MSLPHAQAENPAQPRSASESEPSHLAAKRTPEAGGRPRTKFPLRLSFAPRLVLTQNAAPPLMSIAPLSGPDFLAEDLALKRLLSPAAALQPLALQPLRDPVGLALGVVARLIVAGCAAAAVAMLLVGAIPRPFKIAVPAMSPAAAPPASAGPASKTALTESALAAEPPNGAQPLAGAMQPARIATVSVRSPQAQTADRWALDRDALARLVKRGEDYLSRGDIAAARLIFRRAAETHDPGAALSLAATYDPEVLRRLHVLGLRPDIGQARAWYERAADYGSIEAARRLATLPSIDR